MRTLHNAYIGTKAEVEAISGAFEGMQGYATDTNEFGTFDGSTWNWVNTGLTGSGSDGTIVLWSGGNDLTYDSSLSYDINNAKLTISAQDDTTAGILIEGYHPLIGTGTNAYIDLQADAGTYPQERWRITTSGTGLHIQTGQSGSYENILSTNYTGYVTIGGDLITTGDIGIGGTPESPLHINPGGAGTVTASTSADDLVMEGAGDTGLSILSGNDSGEQGSIYFGSATHNAGFTIQYTPYIHSLSMETTSFVDNSYVYLNSQAEATYYALTRLRASSSTESAYIDVIADSDASPTTRVDIDAGGVFIDGGLHIGGTSAPGDNNLVVDGNIVGAGLLSLSDYPVRMYKAGGTTTDRIIRDWGNSYYWMVEVMLSGKNIYSAGVADWHTIDTGIRLDYLDDYLTGAFGCWGHVSSGDWIGNTYYAEFIGNFRRHSGGYIDRSTGEIVATNSTTWYNNFRLNATGPDADDTILLEFYNSSATEDAGADSMNIFVRIQKSYSY